MALALPDPELISPALDGVPGALDALAEAWLPHVYRWCHRLGGPAVDAEDAAHETLIIMCRRIDSVHGPAQFQSWLFNIARRVIANQRKRAWFKRWVPGATVQEQPAAGWGPERSLEARQAAATVWKVLNSLPTSQKEVLVLVELEERTASEAAELLGIPRGTVKSRLRVAREAFRRAMARIPAPSEPVHAAKVS